MPPRLHHLFGERTWLRCDHRQTTLVDGRVRLPARAHARRDDRVEPEVFAAWMKARGGVSWWPCPPASCHDRTALLANPDGSLWEGGREGWRPLHPVALPDEPRPLGFRPADPPRGQGRLRSARALALDPHGRGWCLDPAAGRVWLLTPDLSVLAAIRLPPGPPPVHLALTGTGALLATPEALWVQRWGGEWERVLLPAEAPSGSPVAVAGLADGRGVALLRLAAPLERDGETFHAQLALISRGAATLHPLPGLRDPLPLLGLPDGTLVVGEVDGPLPRSTRFVRYRLEASGAPRALDAWTCRRFDGRGLLADDDGTVLATTDRGLRPLIRLCDELVPTGRVETFALDAGAVGARWHRLFLDVDLPEGTAVSIETRTSDELPTLTRNPSPPLGGFTATADPSLPLGSRTADDSEGWVPVGALDRRQPHPDVPFPPGRTRPPWDDPLVRGQEERAAGFLTLEGLLKSPPGRFLWLRISLKGTPKRSPALVALRITRDQPSLLDALPAWWRSDPAAAVAMHRVLALFEGELTRVGDRVAALPALFDPRTAPPEALDWLAGFVALTIDQRLTEPVRRTLLSEAVTLYRKRGTLPGLERLCEILAQAPARVVEAWRMRRRTGAILGQPGQVPEGDPLLGPALELGGAPTADPSPDADPAIAFYRRTAHRFFVLVHRACEPDLQDLLEAAIEANKPAHTAHTLCFLGDGELTLGVGSLLGLGTLLGRGARFEPAVLGHTPLAGATLSTPDPSARLGTFVGGARVGTATRLG